MILHRCVVERLLNIVHLLNVWGGAEEGSEVDNKPWHSLLDPHQS